jgi:DNA-binding IclR family transcriptional regulator
MRVTRTEVGYRAPALEKGLAIIDLLSGKDYGLSMVEIARAMGRSHNEIYRMLVVLEAQGFITRGRDEKYILTGRLFELAMRQAPRRNLHDAALPAMHRLAETIWQSCHLVVLSGDDIVVVARVESPDLLGFAVRIGYRRPIGLSTSGRVLYGFASPETRKKLDAALSRQFRSVKAAEPFRRDAERTKKNGVLDNPSDTVSLITDLAAPVFDEGHVDAVASLVVPFVSGPNAHTSIGDAMNAVRAAAADITRVLSSGI